MAKRLGKSTLTDEEKVTEAKRHVANLLPHVEEMAEEERTMVVDLDDALRRYGPKTVISSQVLFWLRDLVLKY
jgi:hypothetical protein